MPVGILTDSSNAPKHLVEDVYLDIKTWGEVTVLIWQSGYLQSASLFG